MKFRKAWAKAKAEVETIDSIDRDAGHYGEQSEEAEKILTRAKALGRITLGLSVIAGGITVQLAEKIGHVDLGSALFFGSLVLLGGTILVEEVEDRTLKPLLNFEAQPEYAHEAVSKSPGT